MSAITELSDGLEKFGHDLDGMFSRQDLIMAQIARALISLLEDGQVDEAIEVLKDLNVRLTRAAEIGEPQ